MNDLHTLLVWDTLDRTEYDVFLEDFVTINTLPSPDTRLFYGFDTLTVEKVLRTTPKSRRFGTLAGLFDYRAALEYDDSNYPFGALMRKVIAIGYFFSQFDTANKELYLHSLKTILEKMYLRLKDTSELISEASSVVAFVASSIANELDVTILSKEGFDSHISIAKQIVLMYLLPGFLVPSHVEFYLKYFLFLVYTGIESPMQHKMLTTIVDLVVSTISMPFKVILDSEHLIGFIIDKISDSKDVSLSIRLKLFNILAPLTAKYPSAAGLITATRSLTAVSKLIESVVDTLNISESTEKSAGYLQNKIYVFNETINIDTKYQLFERNIEIIDRSSIQLHAQADAIPPAPDLIVKSSDAVALLQSIGILSKYVNSTNTKTDYHIKLYASYVMRTKVSHAVINFKIAWIRAIIQQDLMNSVKDLHSVNAFFGVLNDIYSLYDCEKELKSFVDILLFLSMSHGTTHHHLEEVFDFLVFSSRRLFLDKKLAVLIVQLISANPDLFSLVFKKASTVDAFSQLLLDFLGYHIHHREDLKGAQIRATLIQLTHFMTDTYDLRMVLFRSEKFTASLLAQFCDESVFDIANNSVLLSLCDPRLSKAALEATIRAVQHNILPNTLDITISLLSSSIETNSSKLSLVILSSGIIQTLTDVAGKVGLKESLPKLLRLFDLIAKDSVYVLNDDVFDVLSDYMLPQFKNEVNNQYLQTLFYIAFLDREGMEIVRELKNPAPLPAIIKLLSDHEKHLSLYIDFIDKLIDHDRATFYLVAQSEMNTQLIEYLARFRSKPNTTDLFHKVLGLLIKIASVSIKRNQLIQFFRLFPSLPGHVKPAFTTDILKALHTIFAESIDRPPSTFFSFSNDHVIFLRDDFPTMLKEGYAILMHFKLNGEAQTGSLLSLKAPTYEVSLEVTQNKLSICFTNVVIPTNITLPSDTFVHLLLIHNKNSLHLYTTSERSSENSLYQKISVLAPTEKINSLEFLSHLKCELHRVAMWTPVGLPSRRLNSKFNSLDDFFISPDAGLLGSHISEAPIEYKNKPIFLFDAEVTLENSSPSLTSKHTLDFTSPLYTTNPHPCETLMSIGGPSILLPLFSQIEQPTLTQELPEGKVNSDYYKSAAFIDNPELLESLISLMIIIFSKSLSCQKRFYEDRGHKSLAFLISLIDPPRLSLSPIRKLIESVTYEPLRASLIVSVILDGRIFMYLPDVADLVGVISSYPDSIHVYYVFYLLSAFLWSQALPGTKRLLSSPRRSIREDGPVIERPTKLGPMRKDIFSALYEISKSSFTSVDSETLLAFAVREPDPHLAEQYLVFLQKTLHENSSYIQPELSLLPLLTRLTVDRAKIQTLALDILIRAHRDNAKRLNSLSLHKVGSLAVELLNPSSVDVQFVDTAGVEMALFPLYVSSILSLKRKYRIEKISAISTKIPRHADKILVLALMSLLPYPRKEKGPTAELLISTLSSFYHATLESAQLASSLFSLSSFIHIVSISSGNDFGHIVRYILLSLFSKKRPSTPEVTLKLIQMAFEYIFFIPSYDTFYGFPSKSRSKTSFTFSELYKSSFPPFPEPPVFKFDTRTDEEGEWKDRKLAISLRQLIDETATSHDTPQIIEIHSILISYCIRHGVADSNRKLSKFMMRVNKSDGFRGSHKRSLIWLVGSLIRVLNTGKDDKSIYSEVAEIVVSRRDDIERKLKIIIPPVRSGEDLRKVISNSPNHFGQVFIKKLMEAINKFNRIARKHPVDTQDLEGFFELFKPPRLSFGGIEVGPTDEKLTTVAMPEFPEGDVDVFCDEAEKDWSLTASSYRRLYRSLSSPGGPWSSREVLSTKHKKVSSRLQATLTRQLLTVNHQFDRHLQASIARDIGSLALAKEKVEMEKEKEVKETHVGDFALISSDIHEVTSSVEVNENPNERLMELAATRIYPKGAIHGKVSLFKNRILFSSSTSSIEIPLHTITYVLRRRYRLEDGAIEIFTEDGKSLFLFQPEAQKNTLVLIINRLSRMQSSLSSLVFLEVSRKALLAHVESLQQKWTQGMMSNFDYLMRLNLLAGRSYNDLSQYPVLPWVLSDYTSSTIDLDSPSSYRDLTLPLGAMSQARLKESRERYKMAYDEDDRFYYGSLYSSAAVAIGYLVRIEPFTSLHVELQGRRFDVADRLFVSIPRAWSSVISSPSDFRELTPEFFCLPNFLKNADGYDLGTTATKEKVGDVTLPPWASTPEEFIQINRCALENPIVSNRLNHWVDLIFGPGSRGENAREKDNVYHPYFNFENYDKETDEAKRVLMREYAGCFGCIPFQIFMDPPRERIIPPPKFMFKTEPQPKGKLLGKVLSVDYEGEAIYALSDSLDGLVAGRGFEVDTLSRITSAHISGGNMVVSTFPDTVLGIKMGKKAMKITRIGSSKVTCMSAGKTAFVIGTLDGSISLLNSDGVLWSDFRTSPVRTLFLSETYSAVFGMLEDGSLFSLTLQGKRLETLSSQIRRPDNLIVSHTGYVVVSKNDNGRTLLLVYDVNLNWLAEKKLDDVIVTWTCVAWPDGCDYVVAVTDKNTISGFRLPHFELVSSRVCDVPVTSICAMESPPCLVVGHSDGSIYKLQIA